MNIPVKPAAGADERTAGSRLFAIVLAAGSARRYGSTKQLEVFAGDALVTRAVRVAEQSCGRNSILVTGHAASAVHAASAPLQGYFVHNDRYVQGLGSSIACGVAAVRPVADAVLLMLADQPLVTAVYLQSMIDRWHAAPLRAIASRYAGSIGVPAILPAADFDALCALDDDRGAKQILAAHGDNLVLLDCADAARDIDRPADLDALDHP